MTTTTSTSTKTYADLTSGDLSFTNIVANETDIVSGGGFVESFTGNSGDPTASVSGSETGLSWSGITMTTASDGSGESSQTVTITYDVTETGTNFITAIDSLYNIDEASPGTTFTASESIASSAAPSVILATQNYSYGSPAPAPAELSLPVQSAIVTLTLTETATATNAEVSASVVNQLFAEGAPLLAALGDYVWLDTNRNGLADSGETGVAGVTVDLLNANGTSVLEVTTTNASGFYYFTGLLPSTYEVKFVAPLGESFTTEGVSGPIFSSANQTTGITAPVTLTAGEVDNNIDAGLVLPASLPTGVSLDKQISTDGSTWVDVGNEVGIGAGNTSGDPNVLVGSTVYERVIAVNTGGIAITGASVTDAGGNGPSGFTFGGAGTITIAVGGTVTSDVATITAALGYELDTASIGGTSGGNTVTATDQANYTGLPVGITLDKQISTDDVNWVDVGNGNLAQNPSVFTGSTLFERVIVSNTGSVALGSITVSDVGGNGPASFAVGTSLAAGASETSTVATITATGNYELDTATVIGTGSDNYGHTATVTASDQANYTGVAPSVALDKQISTDGTNWVDVGNGNLAQDPSVFTGSAIYERVIVSNTGSVALTSLSVSDVGGNGPASFAVGTSLAVGASETSTVATIAATGNYELDTATVTGTGTDSVGHTQTVTASDQANYTGVAPTIALDKQISTDGSTWVDVGNGNLAQDPSVFVGSSIYERVIVTNTGTVALTSLSVSDVGGNGPASFAVGTSLAAGASETSTVATITATGSYELDTATVKGVGTDSVGHTQTVTASDQANYTGVTPAVALDKQISTDGSTWVDVGNGNLAQDPSVFVGSAIYERVIVTNTGTVALTSLSVTDVGGNGPASFAVGSSLAAGASETSTVATITATGSYELDTATVKGVGTDSVGHTQTVTASDQANYTGVTPAIALDKQISTDGSTWVDVGNGNLAQDPSVFVGSAIYERVIVSNTGTVALTSLSVSDVGGNGPASFAVGTSLAAGASETSTVATIAATGNYELDTATVTGTGTDSVGHTQTVTASDQANYTGVAPAITLDKEISTNGTTWTEVGVGDLSPQPTVAAGSTLYERVVIVNTGSVAITNASVHDVQTTGTGAAASFNFGTAAASTFTLGAGATITSNVATLTAASSENLDTATVTGTATDSVGHTATVTASDQADYSGTTTTPTTGITVNKVPSSMVVNSCGQETYTFVVTNTGSAPVTKISIKDNIGTASNPDYITPTLVTTGFNGTLAAGASISYSVTTMPIDDNGSGCCGTVSHTCSGSNLGSGSTAWFSCSFTPTSTSNGTCYVFKGVQCQVSGGGSGYGGYTVDCPDSEVTFSSSCQQACTTYNASTNCWVTTLPANCNPGDVFLTGCPVTVPSGCSFNNTTCNWSIADSGNNCGSSSVSWSAACQGYSSFNQNGLNGCTDYNNIGVKVCDNSSGYGNGGSTNVGCGYSYGNYCESNSGGWNGWNNYNNSWQGSSNDCAGTPENQYTSTSCGSSGGNNNYGGGGGYGGCGDQGGYGGGSYGGGSGCGSTNTGGCGDGNSGSCAQTQVNATGVADTVTVTGISNGTTVTATDTAEVIVLGCNSDVTVGGAATTASLSTAYGKAQTLEFTYNPSTTVSTKTIGIGTETGSAPGTMAFIAITNNSNPKATGAQVYFEGTVSSGQKLYADASINPLTNTPNTGSAAFMSTTAGADIYADIYSSQAAFLAGAAPVQVDKYNTSGSQAMHLSDQVGSLTLVGYVGSTGGHLVT